jgi:hypothetical protein
MQHPPPLAVETSDAPVTGVTECTRPRCSCSSNGGLAATPSTLAHPGLEVERVRGVQFPGLGSVSLPLPDVGGSTAPLLRSARRSNSPASRRCQGTSAAMGYAGKGRHGRLHMHAGRFCWRCVQDGTVATRCFWETLGRVWLPPSAATVRSTVFVEVRDGSAAAAAVQWARLTHAGPAATTRWAAQDTSRPSCPQPS